jgi:putative transposase
MEGELENHLDEEERSTGNRKNGKTSKKLKTADGTIDLETPRDRATSFEPQIVKKRDTILPESLES